MTEKDSRLPMPRWLVRLKAQSDLEEEDLEGHVHVWTSLEHPLGALAFCQEHQWVEQDGGLRLLCLVCGLTVNREMP